MKPELSIIIVSYNVCKLLIDCIQSVIATTIGPNYEIIVVDNASADGSVDAVKKSFPHIKVIANDRNLGFGNGNNQGYKTSSGDYVLILNPDTVVKSDAIRSVLEFMKSMPDAGMAACRLLNPDDSLQKSIRAFPTIKEHLTRALFIDRLLYRQYWKKTYYKPAPFEIDYCTGAFMMVRREALSEMPLLSPEFFMYSEEKDLALRLRKRGWKTYFVPFGEVIHYGEQSTSQMAEKMFLELQRSQIRFFWRNYRKFHAWALSLTWGLVLFSNFITSIPLILSSKGQRRLKLFASALSHYPSMIESRQE